MVSDSEFEPDTELTTALTGLKPPLTLIFEGNLAMNWRAWYDVYEIYATASGAAVKIFINNVQELMC